jgi:hypothetical protein
MSLTLNMEIQAFSDREKRNQVFEDLKANGNALEKKVVKFSTHEMVSADKTGKKTFKTIWCISYPRS